jgi:DNA helicase HerA-like ATPase
VVAIPTNLEIIEPTDGPATIGVEGNVGMVGAKVRVLDTEYSNLIANCGIDRQHERNVIVIGSMTRDDKVEILLRIEELYRTHFALFGFTGVGKSNLLSTLVAKVLSESQDPLKIVFFDLLSEYTVLLLDELLNAKVHGRILTIGRRTLPEGVFRHINGFPGAPSLDEAARQFGRYTLLPKGLSRHKPTVDLALRDLIREKKLAFYNEAKSLTVWDLFFTDSVGWTKDRRAEKRDKRLNVVKGALRQVISGGDYKTITFTPELAKKVRVALEQAFDQGDGKEFKEDCANHLQKLEDLERATAESYAAGVSLDQLVADLNDLSHPSLWIVQAHNPHELRSFAKRLGEAVYESRRLEGLIDPLVAFIFDEADEFIRRDGTGSYAESAEIAQTLARRGRKFGLGIGIATQRIRYLDSNIMAQPHTYFISKLPRLSDRQAVAEAFGISEELLNQTFKFKKGQWLLISHDATGLETMPLPIRTTDANRRLASWLEQRYAAGVVGSR